MQGLCGCTFYAYFMQFLKATYGHIAFLIIACNALNAKIQELVSQWATNRNKSRKDYSYSS